MLRFLRVLEGSVRTVVREPWISNMLSFQSGEWSKSRRKYRWPIRVFVSRTAILVTSNCCSAAQTSTLIQRWKFISTRMLHYIYYGNLRDEIWLYFSSWLHIVNNVTMINLRCWTKKGIAISDNVKVDLNELQSIIQSLFSHSILHFGIVCCMTVIVCTWGSKSLFLKVWFQTFKRGYSMKKDSFPDF